MRREDNRNFPFGFLSKYIESQLENVYLTYLSITYRYIVALRLDLFIDKLSLQVAQWSLLNFTLLLMLSVVFRELFQNSLDDARSSAFDDRIEPEIRLNRFETATYLRRDSEGRRTRKH